MTAPGDTLDIRCWLCDICFVTCWVFMLWKHKPRPGLPGKSVSSVKNAWQVRKTWFVVSWAVFQRANRVLFYCSYFCHIQVGDQGEVTAQRDTQIWVNLSRCCPLRVVANCGARKRSLLHAFIPFIPTQWTNSRNLSSIYIVNMTNLRLSQIIHITKGRGDG